MTSDALPVVRLSTPAEWLQAIPYLFGFAPRESLVLLGLEGERKRVRFQMRVDLPGAPEEIPRLTRYVVDVLDRQEVERVLVAVYADEPGPPTRGDHALLDGLAELLTEESTLDVVDLLVIRDGRWWSLDCANPRCCPPEGTPLGSPGEASRVAAELVLRGCVARSSREELVREIAPYGGPAAMLVGQSCLAFRDAMWTDAASPGAWTAKWVDRAVARWREALRSPEADGAAPDADAMAGLLVPLEHLTLRDRVAGVCLLKSERAKPLLRSILRGIPEDYVAAPATILGLLEWVDGDGIRASIAFERALTADPAYSFALLLSEGLQHGIRLPESFVADIRAMGATRWRRPTC